MLCRFELIKNKLFGCGIKKKEQSYLRLALYLWLSIESNIVHAFDLFFFGFIFVLFFSLLSFHWTISITYTSKVGFYCSPYILSFMRVSNLCDTMNPWYWLAIPLLVFQNGIFTVGKKSGDHKEKSYKSGRERKKRRVYAVFIVIAKFSLFCFMCVLKMARLWVVYVMYCSCCAYNSFHLADLRSSHRGHQMSGSRHFRLCMYFGFKTINRVKLQTNYTVICGHFS